MMAELTGSFVLKLRVHCMRTRNNYYLRIVFRLFAVRGSPYYSKNYTRIISAGQPCSDSIGQKARVPRVVDKRSVHFVPASYHA